MRLFEESVVRIVPALKVAGIDFVASLPSKSIAPLVKAVDEDPQFIHVPVAHEGDAIGLCAGAALVGRKPAVLMQNSGLVIAAYALLDTLYWFGGLPFLIVLDHRGGFGDTGGFIFHGYAVQVPRLLDSFEIPYRMVHDPDRMADEVVRGARTAEALGRPAAVLLCEEPA